MKQPTSLPKHQVKVLKRWVGLRFRYENQEFKFIQYNDFPDRKEIEVVTHALVFKFKYSEIELFLDTIIKVTTINNAKEGETGNDHPQDRTED